MGYDINKHQNTRNGGSRERPAFGIIAKFFRRRRLARQHCTSLRFVLRKELRELWGGLPQGKPSPFDIFDYPGIFPEIPEAEDIVGTLVRSVLEDAKSRMLPRRIEYEECARRLATLPAAPTATASDRDAAKSLDAELGSTIAKETGHKRTLFAAGSALAFFELLTLHSALLSRCEPPVAAVTLLSTAVIAAVTEAFLIWSARDGVLPVLRRFTHIGGYDLSDDVPPNIRLGNVLLAAAAFGASYLVAVVRDETVGTGGSGDIAAEILQTVGLPMLATGIAVLFREADKAHMKMRALSGERSSARRDAAEIDGRMRDARDRKSAIVAALPVMTALSSRLDILRESACDDVLDDEVVIQMVRNSAEKIADIEMEHPAHQGLRGLQPEWKPAAEIKSIERNER